MATRTFAGTLSTAVETAGNWDVAPIAGDTLVFACTVNNAVCSTDMSATVFAGYTVNATKSLTIANGGAMSFTGTASAITGEVIVQTGGVLNLSDMTCTVTATTGTITMDGGTVNLVRAAATTILQVNGSITSTANVASGGINCNANANNGAYVSIAFGASGSGYSAAVRLPIDATVGANYTYGVALQSRGRLKWVNILHKTGGMGGVYCLGGDAEIIGCVSRGADALNLSGGGYYLEGFRTFIRDSYAYFCTSGVALGYAAAEMVGVTLGQTELGAAAANTSDIYLVSRHSLVRSRNALLASPTEMAKTVNATGLIISTATDNDKSATGFRMWDLHPSTASTFHLIAGEGTVIHTAGGKALSFVTASDTAADERNRLRFPIALWPATHGDTLDVTLWMRSTGAGDKIKVIVDPDSIYGTAKQVELTATNADTWYQATVPTFTVNVGAGVKCVVPIVVQIEEASKTWYADDLAVSVNGKLARAQTLNFGAHDGVLPLESVKTASDLGLLAPELKKDVTVDDVTGTLEAGALRRALAFEAVGVMHG